MTRGYGSSARRIFWLPSRVCLGRVAPPPPAFSWAKPRPGTPGSSTISASLSGSFVSRFATFSGPVFVFRARVGGESRSTPNIRRWNQMGRATQPDARRAENGTCAESSRDERVRCGCRSRRPERGAALARERAESRAAGPRSDLRCRTSPDPRLTHASRCRSPSEQRPGCRRIARRAYSKRSGAPSRGRRSTASG